MENFGNMSVLSSLYFDIACDEALSQSLPVEAITQRLLALPAIIQESRIFFANAPDARDFSLTLLAAKERYSWRTQENIEACNLITLVSERVDADAPNATEQQIWYARLAAEVAQTLNWQVLPESA